ncbi:unnamed protein product, partial [marine sediment metagenome]
MKEIALEVYRNDAISIITSLSDDYKEAVFQDSSISSLLASFIFVPLGTLLS